MMVGLLQSTDGIKGKDRDFQKKMQFCFKIET